MKNKLLNNIGWKILSLIVSIVLWIVVNIINDPSVTQTFNNIPVTLVNTDNITSTGRVYKVLDNTDVVSRVTVKAPRSVVSQMDEDDIVATADVSDISSLDTVSIEFGSRVNADKIDSIRGNIDVVKLDIENKISRTLALSTSVTGTVADGYMVDSITTSQNVVQITGAESVVNSIARAEVTVNVDDFASDINTNSSIVLYDTSDNVVSDKSIQQNIDSVGIKVTILATKVIPLTFDIHGEAASGYRATGSVESSTDNLYVCGSPSSLKNVEAIQLTDEEVDITGAKENVTTTVNIKKLLPEGVRLVDTSEATVNITVYIAAETNKFIDISTEDLELVNVPDNFSATLAIDTGSRIQIRGLNSALTSININTISPVVDLSSYMESENIDTIEEGFYTVNVSFTLPKDVTLVEGLKAVVHVVPVEE